MRISSYRSLLLVAALAFGSTATAQKKNTDPSLTIQKNLTDDQLLDLVQKQTFRYFWDFAHPTSGLARERSNMAYDYGHETTTTGGTGFGIMAIVVATERGWITRDTAVGRLLRMVKFLAKADRYHGVFPHWLNGETGETIPFSSKDDGADLVETSYLMQGLLTAREYFNRNTPKENELRNRITWMWNDVEWNWHTRGGLSMLFWHWSPNNGWSMNHEIRGWNECLITYVLAASSPRYSISPDVYHRGWANSNHFKNQREYYGIKLPLGFDYGGPLFFAHYSFLGIDPKGLKDQYADYWTQNLNHTLINREHCVRNPHKYKGYGPNSWGLTASDNHRGYGAHSPEEDLGVISPTAALSSFPYTPEYSMQALKHFYFNLGDKIWSEYGFVDAFNETENWYAKSHLAIDQGPIIVMIENYRSGLLWKLFMNIPEVQNGLKKLGFESPRLKK
ncbi:MAG TPA: glucoamylase family protein [Chitinophagaceae bacterium]|nr:glucoamylase family protein [Chitinophagaceae bacterium]